MDKWVMIAGTLFFLIVVSGAFVVFGEGGVFSLKPEQKMPLAIGLILVVGIVGISLAFSRIQRMSGSRK